MSVVYSFYLVPRGGRNDGRVPTTVINEEFETFEQVAKYCVLAGRDGEGLPVAYNKETREHYDVNNEFIRKFYKG